MNRGAPCEPTRSDTSADACEVVWGRSAAHRLAGGFVGWVERSATHHQRLRRWVPPRSTHPTRYHQRPCSFSCSHTLRSD